MGAGAIASAITLASFFTFGPTTDALAADQELCPTSAKVKTTTGTWDNLLGDYDDTDFVTENGTLAGCSSSVSVIATTKSDYYLYFSAASLAGKEIFDEDGTLRLSVTGAPGAAGWYVQAFLASEDTLLTKVYGGGGTDGRVNYGHSLTLPDLSSSNQPANTGTASSPTPSYSVEYGYTLTESQRTSVLNGDLAIYIGYLGSSSVGANDTLDSVKMLYTLPTDPPEGGSNSDRSDKQSEDMGNPGTFLTLTGRPGHQAHKSTIIFGTDRVVTGRSFELTISDQSGRQVMLLSQGDLPAGGSFDTTVSFPQLSPGTYAVVYEVSTLDGRDLRLRNVIRIEQDGSFSHITDESLQPRM